MDSVMDEEWDTERSLESSDSSSGTADDGESSQQQEHAPGSSAKRTKAHIKIASENMKGRGAQRVSMSEKWHRIADDMRAQKIAVMALQETHLTDAHVEELEELYGHLRILNTALPENNTGAGGVAIVLNRLLTNCDNVESLIAVPGRAIVCKLEWHRGQFMTIMAIYAPTVKKDNTEFWKKLRSCLKKKRNKEMKPRIMLGDFNQVEDAIDRFPARKTPIDAPDTFAALKRTLCVSDGWRDAFPGKTEWTWRNADRPAMSRLDRIYLTRDLLLACRNWEIRLSNLTRNDHSRISVEIANGSAPDVGPGRWTMKPELMNNKSFMMDVDHLLKNARVEIDSIRRDGRTGERNAQITWQRFKDEVRERARAIMREQAGKRRSALKSALKDVDVARSDLLRALTDEDVAAAQQKLTQAENKAQSLEDNDIEEKFAYRRLRVSVEAETMNKSWFNWARMNRTRESIASVRKPGTDPPVYVTRSKTMAEVGKEYHDSIQADGIVEDDDSRSDDIDKALDPVDPPPATIDFSPLAKLTERGDVVSPIETAKLGSAAGIDGIIYEFWKALAKRAGSDRPDGGKWEDVACVMREVYQDIEQFGICDKTSFTEGWLCPLYKKGDRTEMANYRLFRRDSRKQGRSADDSDGTLTEARGGGI